MPISTAPRQMKTKARGAFEIAEVLEKALQPGEQDNVGGGDAGFERAAQEVKSPPDAPQAGVHPIRLTIGE
ncbi:hypothetical protein [Rhodoblastus acidophilus]|uniref:hypothetical protein n=1 Tax=Rhodoblastus acidophilus TaxID=1074 RepID=UPI000B50B500|nr:hypothetical protein [Rhodoblastus acidophilus]PPQ35175.1 hypothetical protein CKO16_20910 [Rhodoblastus acidophilus]RAI16913.1 hypothetical protein CH337_18830 [Rhodoblastus acidophilus]